MMRWYSIFAFILLFNLTLTALAGFNVFGWSTTGVNITIDWKYYAIAMVGAAISTGIFGVVFIHGGTQVAYQLLTVFFSSAGFFSTVATCRWLDLPPQITYIVNGMVGFLAVFAIAQIMGGRYED